MFSEDHFYPVGEPWASHSAKLWFCVRIWYSKLSNCLSYIAKMCVMVDLLEMDASLKKDQSNPLERWYWCTILVFFQIISPSLFDSLRRHILPSYSLVSDSGIQSFQIYWVIITMICFMRDSYRDECLCKKRSIQSAIEMILMKIHICFQDKYFNLVGEYWTWYSAKLWSCIRV